MQVSVGGATPGRARTITQEGAGAFPAWGSPMGAGEALEFVLEQKLPGNLTVKAWDEDGAHSAM
eukprot:COSAG01_NODE_19892_length_983_cov_1.409502_2_plen_64_part_00